VETDAPYIGKFPWDVKKAAEIIAGSREEKLEKIGEETRKNAKLAFGID
jgi:Tat protein secretion system quality control protein TatD with DNase activity